MGKITELPVKLDLTIDEAVSITKRRGATQGVITFFDKDGFGGSFHFGSPSKMQTLWLSKELELLAMGLLDVD